ncbi:hypothetical protein MMC12_001101 [Toensbergia leucococca]|nr:hypothetical protein [Toensbergia leucococca]
MRLLDALNSNQLAIPTSMKAAEDALRKDFLKAERKFKADKKKLKVEAHESHVTAPKKRSIDDSAQDKPGKKAKANATPISSSPISASAFLGLSGSSQTRIWPKQTARRPRGTLNVRPSSDPAKGGSVSSTPPLIVEDEPPQVQVRPKPFARRSRAGFPTGGRMQKTEPSPEPSSRFSTKQTARRSRPFPIRSSRPARRLQNEMPEYKVTTTTPKSLGLVNGYYEISCPTVEEEWPGWCNDGLGLTLTLDGTRLWGAYEFGMFEGIMMIHQNPTTVGSGEELTLSWRGREMSEHEMSFSFTNTGGISFLGDGRIEGWADMYGEKMRFFGRRQQGTGAALRTAASMRREYDEYNETAYDDESPSRWR